MANDITNIVKMVGTDERIKEVLETIKPTDKRGYAEGYEFPVGAIDFNTIIPMPENIFKGDLGPEERKIYGTNNWYDWSVENWGTKWNAYGFREFDKETNSIEFETAWSTVPSVISKLSSMFPDIAFELHYADEDFSYNTGVIIFDNGHVVSEDIPEGGSDEAVAIASRVLGWNPNEEDEDVA